MKTKEELDAKVEADLMNRAAVGNKCPLYEAWDHKKYLRKVKNST